MVPDWVILIPNIVPVLLISESPKTKCWWILPCKFSNTDALSYSVSKPLIVDPVFCETAKN